MTIIFVIHTFKCATDILGHNISYLKNGQLRVGLARRKNNYEIVAKFMAPRELCYEALVSQTIAIILTWSPIHFDRINLRRNYT